MVVAISASDSSLNSIIDPRFGRCGYFLFVETDTLDFEAVENAGAEQGGGAGIQAAKLVAGHGAAYVITGNCGPNAHRTLSAAGIKVILNCSGKVRDVVNKFKAGELRESNAANVESHFGIGSGR